MGRERRGGEGAARKGRSGDVDKEEGGWKATVSDRGPRFCQVSRWRPIDRARWLHGRGPTLQGRRLPAELPSPRWRWGEPVAMP